MNKQLLTSWNAVMDHRLNPLRHMDLASSHYLMQVLAWMWSMIFSLSFLSIYFFGYVWLSHMLVIAGVFFTASIFKNAETKRDRLTPAPYLSGGCNTVWKMDSEA